VADGYRVQNMRQFSKIIWNQYAEKKKAPRTWGAADEEVSSDFHYQMCRHYSEFALCEHNWKSQLFATENYPNWTHGKSTLEPVSKRARTSSEAAEATEAATFANLSVVGESHVSVSCIPTACNFSLLTSYVGN
jgi:hypothetical protein